MATIIDQFPRPVREIENVWIDLADGTRLAARLWLPADAEDDPVPCILEYLPYRKRDFMRGRDEAIHRYVAGHGYAALRVDIRGSGDSDGILTDEYTEQELADAGEVIAWAADQPWCSGAVGMTGISWGGFNALQVAARQPPALKAIITLCSTDDRYADDAHYMGGCLLNENLQWGAFLWTYNAYPPDPEIVGEDHWRQMWQERLESSTLFPQVWMEHPHRDAFWKHGSVCEDFSAIEVPVYAIGGWADGYSNAVPRLLSGLSSPRKGLIGPWAHVFPHAALPGPSIGYLQEAIRWWDHWLKDEATGIMDEPMLRVWMQDSMAPHPTIEYRPGRWVAEADWPSDRIGTQDYRFARGRLIPDGGEDTGSTRLMVSSPLTTGLAGGEWCGFGSEGENPGDQRSDDGRSLVFDTEPLAEDIEILGAPVVTLDFDVDQPAALVAVRLNEVAPNGASLRVTYGLLNLCHREEHEHPAPLEPGERYRVDVQLNDIAQRIPAGHRLRVAISTNYWPIAWPSPRPVVMGVETGGCRLALPVRPPDPADEALSDFAPPERGPRDATTQLRPEPSRRVIERDLATNETVYTLSGDGGEFGGASLARVEAINLQLGYRLFRRFRIDEFDPTKAVAEMRQQVRFMRSDWNVRIESHIRMSCDATDFRLQAELDAFEDDSRVFARSWDVRIPRKLV